MALLLFVLSVGLSVTLGMMNFVNLAHCAFAMLGGYVTVTLINHLGWPFLATLPVSFVAAGLVSVLFERTLYRHLYGKSDLDHCLLTIGIVFVAVASAAYVFGTLQQPVRLPSWLRGHLDCRRPDPWRLSRLPDRLRPQLMVLLVYMLEYTRFGAVVRAAVDNQRMARGLGINVDRVFMLTFALGSASPASVDRWLSRSSASITLCPALSHLCAHRRFGGRHGLDLGSFAAAVVLGVSDIAGKYWFPQLGSFLIYLVMVGILMWRPLGLFGKTLSP